MKQNDVLQVEIADLHSGSNYALFPNKFWQGINNANHTPTSRQVEIYNHFAKFGDLVGEMRKGKKVILIHGGDAIDGDHHNSGDVCSIYENEQVDIHEELIIDLKKRMKWQAGDELYYTKGTNIHTRENEETIARDLDAVPAPDGQSCWQMLELETNGKLTWVVHTGPGRGNGPNEGNLVRSWLKNIYFDSLKDGKRPPDILYTAHVHDLTYATYDYRNGMEFTLMHGLIIPSWQEKTRYGYMRAPVARNKIGGVIHEIKADGTVCVPKFCVM
jgi:hypothetical protein